MRIFLRATNKLKSYPETERKTENERPRELSHFIAPHHRRTIYTSPPALEELGEKGGTLIAAKADTGGYRVAAKLNIEIYGRRALNSSKVPRDNGASNYTRATNFPASEAPLQAHDFAGLRAATLQRGNFPGINRRARKARRKLHDPAGPSYFSRRA